MKRLTRNPPSGYARRPLYFGSAVRVRLGYDNQRRREIAADAQPRLAGFSGGVGIVLEKFSIDYALVALGMPGDVHRVSLNVRL